MSADVRVLGQGSELVAGRYTVCLLPLPAGLQGMEAMQYATTHGEDLPAFCKAVNVAAAPAEGPPNCTTIHSSAVE